MVLFITEKGVEQNNAVILMRNKRIGLMKFMEKRIVRLFTKSGGDFMEDECMKFSASLSYYTIFALPSFAIILITVLGYFIGEEVVSEGLLRQINKMIGSQTAEQMRSILENRNLTRTTIFETVVSVVTLVISATGMFGEIQSSINDIWKIKSKSNDGVKRFAIDQFFSLSMIGVMGFILVVSLLIDSFLDILHTKIELAFGNDNLHIADITDTLFTFVIITLLVAYIYKELPDAKIKLKDVFVGALFTAVLFMIGKYLIGIYLENSSNISLYGAAGSILILLMWVYYSAMILYFGAVFTKNYALIYGTPIEPTTYTEFKT